LAVAAKKKGFDVAVVTRVKDHGGVIQKEGIRLIPFQIERRSLNPFSMAISVFKLIRIFRSEKPDIIHNVALKPVFLGSLAALILGFKNYVNALAGLGWLYSSSSRFASLLRIPVRRVLKILLSKGSVIVQNPDDLAWLLNLGIAKKSIYLIRGSGVDMKEFHPKPLKKGLPIVILVARMLWDKGVGDFVEAARRITSNRGKIARFVLAGSPDDANPASIPESTLKAWNTEGVVEWWGRRSDMSEVLSQCHIACLPSFYGEGIPKSLLEALAAGLPVVTTDTPGCREVVPNKKNGVLVPPRDIEFLADALTNLIENPNLRKKMGMESRKLAEKEFSIEKVISSTLNLYSGILK
jgi:glycosyltransferase involved in cell wall biosynthesis